MARIKSRGNASTELAFMALLRRNGVTGWRRHVEVLGIRPDFVFRKTKIAVFVDGCFWHKCADHCGFVRLPPFWQAKVTRNRERDGEQNRKLIAAGWEVVRVWEHDLKGVAR